jgi:hypothetical protein
VKRQTIEARAEKAAETVALESDVPWIIWCHTDYEADALQRVLPDAIEIRGSQSPDEKEEKIEAFSTGKVRHIIGKPSMIGYGLDWSHCARMAFVGQSFSYETWYQAVRRCWRFGQKQRVVVHLIVAEGEAEIGRVIDRKADDHSDMKRDARRDASRHRPHRSRQITLSTQPQQRGLHHGYPLPEFASRRELPSLQRRLRGRALADARRKHWLFVYSPPFGSLFVYSESAADMGNSTDEEFAEHYAISRAREIPRHDAGPADRRSLLRPADDEMAGRRDRHQGFLRPDHPRARGCRLDTARPPHDLEMPVVEMTRTKHVGLLYKQLQKDSSKSRGGMPDYLLTFMKPGENPTRSRTRRRTSRSTNGRSGPRRSG